MDDEDFGGLPPDGGAPPPMPSAAQNPFGGGGAGGAGVLSKVAGFASNLQRKAEAGEARNADAEPIPYLLMEEILERLKMLNYEREMPGSFFADL